MGRLLFCVFLLLLSSLPVGAQSSTVSASFQKTDIREAIRFVADKEGLQVVVQRGLNGRVTLELRKVSVDEAFRRIVATQPGGVYLRRLSTEGPVIVASTPEDLRRISEENGYIRMEYLLEEAPAEKVVEFLEPEYRYVEFIKHPTMNGFYARGVKDDLLQIKRELTTGERIPAATARNNR